MSSVLMRIIKIIVTIITGISLLAKIGLITPRQEIPFFVLVSEIVNVNSMPLEELEIANA